MHKMNIAWLGFVSGLLGCTQEAPVSEQPMVVLVSIDTLRADHLSSYGYERKTSPFLDTLAESGTRFEYARSASPMDPSCTRNDAHGATSRNAPHCG